MSVDANPGLTRVTDRNQAIIESLGGQAPTATTCWGDDQPSPLWSYAEDILEFARLNCVNPRSLFTKVNAIASETALGLYGFAIYPWLDTPKTINEWHQRAIGLIRVSDQTTWGILGQFASQAFNEARVLSSLDRADTANPPQWLVYHWLSLNTDQLYKYRSNFRYSGVLSVEKEHVFSRLNLDTSQPHTSI